MAFWGVLYFDPVRMSTVTDTWLMIANEGAVWGVATSALPLVPGQSVILTLNDGYYVEGLSNYSGLPAANTPIFVQVDSAHAGTTYGAVLESHEIVGGVYNNIEVVVYKPE